MQEFKNILNSSPNFFLRGQLNLFFVPVFLQIAFKAVIVKWWKSLIISLYNQKGVVPKFPNQIPYFQAHSRVWEKSVKEQKMLTILNKINVSKMFKILNEVFAIANYKYVDHSYECLLWACMIIFPFVDREPKRLHIPCQKKEISI